MKIVLIMPGAKLYQKGRGFRKNLRYAPLTLTTLAGLVSFKGKKDGLKQGVADIDERRIKDPRIKYFLEKNPH